MRAKREFLMTITINFDLTMLLLVGVNVLCIFVYVGMLKLRAYRLEQARERIVEEVAAYFARIGVAAKAEAIKLPAAGHFIIIADTEPLKRFRHSHIVEMMLIGQIKNATGHTVDKVFWRFPLPAREGAAVEVPEDATVPPPRAPEVDEYLEQGLTRLSAPDGLEVHEDSWAHYQEALHEREEAHGAASESESGRAPSAPAG